MTPQKAKKLTAEKLASVGASFTKLTAKSISFQDLARDNCVFITVHGFEGLPVHWEAILRFAKENGFRVN